MNLKDSIIVSTTLTKLFPMVVLFSLYMMSYGGAFPGGGFQGGVILGTMIVVMEAAMERRLYPDFLFNLIELLGVLILFALLFFGWILTGLPFGGLYGSLTESLPLGNVLIWLLSLAIYLEVSGSMVLIFRKFLFWSDPVRTQQYQAASRTSKQTGTPGITRLKVIRIITLVALAALALASYLLIPEFTPVFHSEVQDFRSLTRDLGIQNMVATVYLGPRMMDTVLEVLVVMLTVFGMRAIGGKE